ncbi:hypothetical protein AB6A40_003235 [Gnathostoma spinigerum]|uniref:CDC20/Fizzy WD40 domain-containing protein n=1 Tax=Gnathostoma spinigerum TaxID=75299 RepID=A0ABD6EGL6_9BILA
MAYRESNKATPVRGLCQQLSDITFSVTNKTPNSAARANRTFGSKTPNQSASVLNRSKGLRKRDITPSRNPNFSGVGEGDRFIPSRSGSQFELANHLLVNHSCEESTTHNESMSAPNSPNKAEKEMKIQMMRTKSSGEIGADERILCYKKGQAPVAPYGFKNHPKVIYSSSAANSASSVKKGLRHIPAAPERILDAPEFRDDYYLNLLHWSVDNVIAVALGNTVYLWNAATGEIDTLFEVPESEKYITSVQWASVGQFLAVGISDGKIKLFDPARTSGSGAELRTMQSQLTGVGCMAWREHILTGGCKSGRIYHHDVRVAAHQIGRFDGHTQAVCGLQWSDDGRFLASGGGDNICKVWDPCMLTADEPEPLYVLSDHLASVKVGFNTIQRNSLATIGGTTDRTIKFWNLESGALMQSVQTDSQVNGIAFNPFYKEVITAHGYPNNVLKIWKYPSMTCIQDLTGHTERVLGLAMSPCTQYVMSASSDESLRLWLCFKIDKSSKRDHGSKGSKFRQSVR